MTVIAPELPAEPVRDYFGRRAAAVDQGEADVRDGLRFLAGLGLLGHPELRVSFELIRVVARSCLASAFSIWAHTMVVDCLAAAASAAMVRLAGQLRGAALVGSTAMAPAVKYMAGLGELPVHFRRDGEELVLQGRIPWASNLYDRNLVVVLSARDEAGGRVIVAVTGDDPALELGRPARLLAMSGTASSDLRLDGVRVPPEAVISTDFPGYMKAMKPRLLVLQTAFCLGLADASLDAASCLLDAAMERYRDDHAELAGRLRDLEARASRLVGALAPVPDAVETRLRAAQLAGDAVQLELRVAGGRGFTADSPTARRYREAAFLPVQTPTEAQLQWELS
ncbi:MAG TPA: acyl-CoA dehydrogenase family protein [Trebonia sp.]|nr:acyl-CoA dehydrogenase family protein [Trebonia sp.]